MDKNTTIIPPRTVPSTSRLTEGDCEAITKAVAKRIDVGVRDLISTHPEVVDELLTDGYVRGVYHQAAFTAIGCNAFSLRPSEIEIINGIVDLQMMLSTIA